MIEELKLILETLEKAGDGAFRFAIWYLVLTTFQAVAAYSLFLAGVVVVCKSAQRLTLIISGLKQVGRALDFDENGVSDYQYAEKLIGFLRKRIDPS